MFLAYVYLQSYPQFVNAQFGDNRAFMIVNDVLSLYNFSLCQPSEHTNRAKPRELKSTALGQE
jgi:hypothetical protein